MLCVSVHVCAVRVCACIWVCVYTACSKTKILTKEQNKQKNQKQPWQKAFAITHTHKHIHACAPQRNIITHSALSFIPGSSTLCLHNSMRDPTTTQHNCSIQQTTANQNSTVHSQLSNPSWDPTHSWISSIQFCYIYTGINKEHQRATGAKKNQTCSAREPFYSRGEDRKRWGRTSRVKTVGIQKWICLRINLRACPKLVKTEQVCKNVKMKCFYFSGIHCSSMPVLLSYSASFLHTHLDTNTHTKVCLKLPMDRVQPFSLNFTQLHPWNYLFG